MHAHKRCATLFNSRLSGVALGPLLLFLGSLIVLHPATSHGASAYEFSSKDWLASADALPGWRETLARHDQDSEAFVQCQQQGNCSRLQTSVAHILTRAESLPQERKIRLVNAYINQRRYKIDRSRAVPHRLSDKPKLRNHWATLMEFMRRGGDCEDYASAKYFLLRELGFAAEDMRIVVTRERRTRDNHAVLALRFAHNDVVWLLDTDRIHRRKPNQSRYVFALNEQGIWDHAGARPR